jgi:hypothetical protein
MWSACATAAGGDLPGVRLESARERSSYVALRPSRQLGKRHDDCRRINRAARLALGAIPASRAPAVSGARAPKDVLLCALRRIGLHDTDFAKATCGTIRLKLLKIGAIVRLSVGRIKIAMASACPAAQDWARAAIRLAIAALARASPA